ncbi:MAG: type IV pilus twitching motility protein PilT [Verrucomicrobiales bacterium]|nr:type IV pilus twitching motility protein PilT [Verrucomicrobiales bacterium]
MPDLLTLLVDTGSSDLHVRVGIPPAYRDSGTLVRVEGPDCEPEDVEYLVKSIASDDQIQAIRTQGGADFGFAFGTKARFRVSAFKERGNMALVLRQIPNDLLTIEQIGLDQGLVDKLLSTPRGMILVTGPTGSGKSTTLASMLNIINETDDECHMITIEDPIEFYHPHKKAVTSQREVHVDVPSFAEALRRALRQDPEVILVGELRDLETIEMAVSAAETGHVVFGTLHTTGAAKTVDRIVNAFPMQQQETIRIQLSTVLQCVISQILCKRLPKGRVAIHDIMVMTPSISALIRDNKTFRIPSDQQTGQRYGMVTLDDGLFNYYGKGVVTREDCVNKAQDHTGMMMRLKEWDEQQAALQAEQLAAGGVPGAQPPPAG